MVRLSLYYVGGQTAVQKISPWRSALRGKERTAIDYVLSVCIN